MKVLLDESVDVEFRHYLPGHDVYTVTYMRWKGLKNGALIARAAGDGFDVLVTTDRSIAKQQNISTLPLILAIMFAKRNGVRYLAPLAPKLLDELAKSTSRRVVEIRP